MFLFLEPLLLMGSGKNYVWISFTNIKFKSFPIKCTAWKKSVFGVFLVRIFPHSDTFHAMTDTEKVLRLGNIKKLAIRKLFAEKLRFSGNCLIFSSYCLTISVWKFWILLNTCKVFFMKAPFCILNTAVIAAFSIFASCSWNTIPTTVSAWIRLYVACLPS